MRIAASQRVDHIRMLGRLAPLDWERDVDLLRPRVRYPEVVEAALRYDRRVVIFYDKRVNLYGIARSPEQGGDPVLQDWWCHEDNTFRPLSMELLRWLYNSDKWRHYKNADDLADRMEAEERRREEKARRDFADDIDHITRSHRRQLQRAKNMLRDISGRFESGV